MIRTKSVYSPIERKDGFRILATRFQGEIPTGLLQTLGRRGNITLIGNVTSHLSLAHEACSWTRSRASPRIA